MVRGSAPLLSGLTAGGCAALLAALASLELRSPDPVFFNSLTVGVMALLFGLWAGSSWGQLASRPGGQRTYALGWVVVAVVALVVTAALNAVFDGLLTYGAPLAVLVVLVSGGLTPVLAAGQNSLLRVAAPVAVLVGAGVCAALAGRAAPPREVVALPPPARVTAANVESPVRVDRVASNVPAASVSASVVPSAVASVAPVVAAARAPSRVAGQYAGLNFAIGSGSKATFTVREQLARMPLPNEAVVSTTALSGDLHLDGRSSSIQLDLQRLSSDQPNRDKYIRGTMFPGEKSATFAVDNPRSLPEGAPAGEPLEGKVNGTLAIKGGTYPLTFDWQARDDGDVVYVIAHTTFTWHDLGLETPNSAAIVSADDLVSCDLVLAARPK